MCKAVYEPKLASLRAGVYYQSPWGWCIQAVDAHVARFFFFISCALVFCIPQDIGMGVAFIVSVLIPSFASAHLYSIQGGSVGSSAIAALSESGSLRFYESGLS
jgi:hypothetical protein